MHIYNLFNPHVNIKIEAHKKRKLRRLMYIIFLKYLIVVTTVYISKKIQVREKCIKPILYVGNCKLTYIMWHYLTWVSNNFYKEDYITRNNYRGYENTIVNSS